MKREELIAYLDAYLHIATIRDYGPQGLQVESEQKTVQRIALMVDVSLAGIAAAAEWRADMLLVHHGIFWRSPERLVGPLGARVRQLLKHNINLYAAHLPLDVHPEVGNNAGIAQMLNLTIQEWWGDAMGTPLGVLGALPTPITRKVFMAQVNNQLKTTARLLPYGPEKVQKIAILSGAGADRIAEVKALGADTYLTGETSHAHYWGAVDYGLNLIYAGHYATETVGVQLLGSHLADRFNIETKFFDFPTGM